MRMHLSPAEILFLNGWDLGEGLGEGTEDANGLFAQFISEAWPI